MLAFDDDEGAGTDEQAQLDGQEVRKSKKGRKGKKQRRGKKRRGKGGDAGVCQQLQCTAEQTQPINELVRGYRRESRGDKKLQRQAWADLAVLYGAETLDEIAIDAAYDRVAEGQSEQELRARQAIEEIHALLDPQQRELLARSLAARGPVGFLEPPERKGKRRGKRRGGKRRGGTKRVPAATQPAGSQREPAERAPVEPDPSQPPPSSSVPGAGVDPV